MKIELNRDQIKYIAVFTMLLNHVANIFLATRNLCLRSTKGYRLFYSTGHVLVSG